MTTRPWIPFYVGDYLADTGHLDTTQHGAYLLLIFHYWRTGSLPDDDKQLANITRLMMDDWLDIRPIIQAFFFDGWKHRRIEFELGEVRRLSAAGKKGGVASGQSRRKKIVDSAPSIVANDLPTIDERFANDVRSPNTNTNTHTSEAKASDGEPPSCGPPVYTDSKHELWGEGIAILGQLGVPNKAARPNIGRWLRDSGDDAQVVLGSIQRARDHRVIDPIPWITQAIGNANGNASHSSGRNSAAGKRQPNTHPVVAAMGRIADERMRAHDERESSHSGEPDANGSSTGAYFPPHRGTG